MIVGLLLALGACGGEETPPLTEDDAGSEVQVEPGAVVQIELESDRGAGLAWKLAAVPDGVTTAGDRYREPPPEDLGDPGTQTLTFEVSGGGGGTLRLEYVRSSDAAPVAERVVEYVIRVGATP